MFLSFDGGGTATRAILFNEGGPIGYGQSGGTNTNFTTREDCRKNIAQCLDQALQGHSIPLIETLYAVIVGPRDILEEELRARAEVRDMCFFSEGQAGVLAGALKESGLVAMSGTGSDAFYIGPDGYRAAVGGYGSILGDDGSGAWIAQGALRKAIAYGEGWGEPTIFLKMISETWKISHKFGFVEYIYSSPAPFRKVASALPVVAEAARQGDAVCLALFKRAGELMALQMLALIRQEQPTERLCVCCGGAWKAHPLMYETFVKMMHSEAPEIAVRKPAFEQVMAGAVAHALRANPEKIETLEERYRRFTINW